MVAKSDYELHDWSDLKNRRDWSTLLLGNGLSINLWPGFGYKKLFDEATFSRPAGAIFQELGTNNFEQCLECLYHAAIVATALDRRTTRIDDLYVDVRDALFDAVGHVHVAWDDFPGATLVQVARAVNRFGKVFTTSYDLCLYWSHMWCADEVDMADLFWNASHVFDPNDIQPFRRSTTLVHYLHGGLHLWTDDRTGENGKWTSDAGNLLRSLPGKYGSTKSKRPLFVSEATSKAKQRTIRQSPYLSFCIDQLRDDEGATVIFGQALTSQDYHIARALAHGRRRHIAVSMVRRKRDSWRSRWLGSVTLWARTG